MRSSGSRFADFTRHAAAPMWVVALLLAAGACKRPEPPAEAAIVGGIPECPGDGFQVTIKDGRSTTTITQISLVDPQTDIPEFHDCQRFIKADGTYDTRYAIFAIAGLGSLAQQWSADSAHADSAGTAGVRISRTAAVIYSWGGTYRPLWIGPGFNCLLLYRDAGHQWQATMLHKGADPDCPAMVLGENPALVGRPLLTKPPIMPRVVFGDADYPAVGRWEWDAENRQQYIGIKCGAAWCEIGNAAGFTQNPGMAATATWPSDAGPGGLPPSRRWRTVEIGGWYDRQTLAVPDGAGGVRPGSHRGAVVPAKGLGEFNAASDFAPSILRPWTVSAYAFMEQDYINSKVHLERGQNTISLCHGTQSECHVPPLTGKCATGTWEWWARTVTKTGPGESGGGSYYTCVTMTSHASYDIPAAARWRWDDHDETVWIRCTAGCCKLEG